MRNNKYAKEFRDSTVQLVINGEKSAVEIAKDGLIKKIQATTSFFSYSL